MTTFQITTFTGSLQNQSTLLINARELHQMLQVGRDFSNWIKSRISDYGFIENEDYTCSPNLVSGKNQGFSGVFAKFGENLGGRPRMDYHITLDMAKELCMLERSELGQQARRYFIRMEKEALQARQKSSNDMMEIPTAKYIELLETQNQLLKQSLKPTNYKLRLSEMEKRQILSLHQQGLSTGQIVQQCGRSESAVRAVIRGNGEV